VAGADGYARKAAEAARWQAEQRFRDLLESAPDAILTCDAEGRIVLANSQAEVLFGYGREELVDQPVELLLPEAVRDRHVLHRTDFLTNPRIRPMGWGQELHARRKDGRLVPVEISLSPLASAGEPLVMAAIRDVTARKQMEAALSESEERFRLAFNAAPIGMALATPDGRLLEVNHALCQMLGYSRRELLEQRSPVLTHPDDLAESRARIEELLAGAVHSTTLEKRYLHREGQVIWTHYTASLLRAADGRPLYFIYQLQDITARKAAEAAQAQLAAIVAGSSDAIIGMTLDRIITSWNAGAERLYGYIAAETIGRSMDLLAVPGGPHEATQIRETLQRGEAVVNLETMRRHRDGRMLAVSISISPIKDASGVVVGAAGIHRDIAARKVVEAALRQSEARFRTMVENAPVGACIMDQEGRFEAVNEAYARLFGYQRDELIGQHFGMLFPASEQDHIRAWYAERVRTGATVQQEYEMVAKGGTPVTVLTGSIQLASGADGRITRASFVTDLTLQKQTEQQLAQAALHDALTGLPNRVRFQDRLAHALRTAQQDQESLALLLIDLDGFKAVNDSLGHAAGDALLRVVATRLQAAVCETDMVARLGGDEFAMLLPAAGEVGAERVARQIGNALAEPVPLREGRAQVGGSIGIALYPEHAEDAEALKHCADQAMYAAKRAGGGYRLYGDDQEEPGAEPGSLGIQLRRAILAGELRLQYQPVVRCATGQVERAEALVRWQHPRLGLLSPDHFIPLAERTGMIIAVMVWVLEQAIRQCADWRGHGLDLGVGVNISPVILEEPQFADLLVALLREYDLPPAALTLEIAESALLAQPARVVAALEVLAHSGVRLAIDEFGSGYGSISQLRRLPVQEVKLDRSLLTDLGREKDRALLAFLLGLGVALDVAVVVEGVETKATWEMLAALNCDLVQGSYLSRPCPPAQFEGWLKARLRRRASPDEAGSAGTGTRGRQDRG
jgi:diguanylate cyclase (GGDEF)-like protein/PAS domain S-box-containing protein